VRELKYPAYQKTLFRVQSTNVDISTPTFFFQSNAVLPSLQKCCWFFLDRNKTGSQSAICQSKSRERIFTRREEFFMFFAPYIVIYLHNTKQRNALVSKFIFHFCCHLPRGFIFRKTVLYAVWYAVWWIEAYPPYCIPHCMYVLPEDKPTKFETCRRQQKLNINLENCALLWLVLCHETRIYVFFVDK
jgi:hypothetical protein